MLKLRVVSIPYSNTIYHFQCIQRLEIHPCHRGQLKGARWEKTVLLSCLFLYHYVRGMQNCGREPLYHLLLLPVKAAFPSKQFTWFSDLSVTRLLQITYYQEARTQALVFSIGISWQEKSKHTHKKKKNTARML